MAASLALWEYLRVAVSGSINPASFNTLGAQGWELVGFDMGAAYFKRPAPPKPKQRNTIK